MKVFMPANAGWCPRLNSEIVLSMTSSDASTPNSTLRFISSSCFFWVMCDRRSMLLAACVSSRLTPPFVFFAIRWLLDQPSDMQDNYPEIKLPPAISFRNNSGDFSFCWQLCIEHEDRLPSMVCDNLGIRRDA